MKQLRRHPEATLITLVIVLLGIAGLATFIRSSSEAELGWRGIIVPGQTTEQEVVALWGQPNKIIQCNLAKIDYFVYSDVRDWQIIEPCLFSPLIYEYHQPDSRATHQVHFRDNVVWLIIENAHDDPYDEFLIEDVIAKYGWRERERNSRKWKIEHFLYCEQGVIVAHNDYQALMRFYFEPADFVTCDTDFFLYFISRDERAYGFDLKQQVDQPGVVIKK